MIYAGRLSRDILGELELFDKYGRKFIAVIEAQNE